jgi:1,2-dihydroxy-3-keto-5-methylthiopentene dioxygenase
MTIRAWYMDSDESTDQRALHRRDHDADVSAEVLESLGVLHWSGITGAEDPVLAKIRADRGYTYSDVINVSPNKLPEYETKIKSFYREHIHYDEEIRFCMDGSGFFDVRGLENEWIRVAVDAGDLIVLPEGIYHRFTCDENNYILAMRLFVGEPIWTPYNRDEIDEMKNASRLKYEKAFLKKVVT